MLHHILLFTILLPFIHAEKPNGQQQSPFLPSIGGGTVTCEAQGIRVPVGDSEQGKWGYQSAVAEACRRAKAAYPDPAGSAGIIIPGGSYYNLSVGLRRKDGSPAPIVGLQSKDSGIIRFSFVYENSTPYAIDEAKCNESFMQIAHNSSPCYRIEDKTSSPGNFTTNDGLQFLAAFLRRKPRFEPGGRPKTLTIPPAARTIMPGKIRRAKPSRTPTATN
ncbi:hypothetical protein CC78DRAFT_578476 [Lojkania enalia]|uniref:Uncharacterized protein n=1 Tax=Lojkania enalia TaxID=147567 RepID=A0A9P4KBD3_9PLEO|nr:hypothetical protein CC78DRAFT_578476 [Didymosphaeria enalia]